MASKMMPIIGETVGETVGETHGRQLSRARTGGETDVPPPLRGGLSCLTVPATTVSANETGQVG